METNSKCLIASQIDQFVLIEVRENQREKKKGKLIMDNAETQATLGTRQRTMTRQKTTTVAYPYALHTW